MSIFTGQLARIGSPSTSGISCVYVVRLVVVVFFTRDIAICSHYSKHITHNILLTYFMTAYNLSSVQ